MPFAKLSMGRTIPSFRIATVLEEKEWKLFRKYLKNKNDKKLFTHMFSIANLYNSACSNAVNPIRIHPIIMSIILHHYKMVKERTSSFDEFGNSSDDHNNDFYDYNHNIDSKILKQEIDKWYNFSFVLRKTNRILFEEMLQSSYKYSSSINVKGENYTTESLFMSLIFDQHKILLINAVNNNKLDCYL
jgi:hypothetical protein